MYTTHRIEVCVWWHVCFCDVWIHVKLQSVNLYTAGSMEQNPPWEADSRSSVRKRNPKFHYCVHMNPSLVPIQSQISPIRILTSHLFITLFTITFPSTSKFPKWILPSIEDLSDVLTDGPEFNSLGSVFLQISWMVLEMNQWTKQTKTVAYIRAPIVLLNGPDPVVSTLCLLLG